MEPTSYHTGIAIIDKDASSEIQVQVREPDSSNGTRDCEQRANECCGDSNVSGFSRRHVMNKEKRMRTIAFGIFLAVGIIVAPACDTAEAAKLCLQVSFNKKTGKTTTKRTIAASCPKGYTELVDTATFVGPQGPAGKNGANGANGSNGTNGTNGTNGFVPLDSCMYGSTLNSSCAEGAVCRTTLSCGEVAGASADDLMLSWVFDVSNKSGYVASTTQLVRPGKNYPSGIEIATTSETGWGSHTPSLAIVCCAKGS